MNEASLLEALNSFDARERRRALGALLDLCPERPSERPWVNMHMHSFFSFNGEGWSPSRLAWEARRVGLFSLALCDFDVLDGLDELFEAADLLALRAAAGFESRVFFAEYGDVDVNSPGEPGVFYFMGMGFAAPPASDSPAAVVFADMLERAHGRNRAVIERINGKLDGLVLDYEQDVLPLTPAGNATERHIVRSYYDKALAAAAGDRERAAAWWAGRLGLSVDQARDTVRDINAFLDLLRSKLIKRGGLGYMQPTPDTFPPLDRVIGMIRECRAIPMSAWLDGTTPGESDPDEQLECLTAKGVEAVNIIPDRNWNIRDVAERQRKVAALNRYVEAARRRHLPINVGTELNKPGQRFVDDFAAPALRPFHPDFLTGARVVVGHTRLLRYAGLSYIDSAARDEFPRREERNRAFAAVGGLPAPDAATRRRLDSMTEGTALAYLMDSARRGAWA
ncbi:MAG: hypothetical protein GXP31_06380 [Kiritimatiellaeota bacterium]|nr:hypothetical protein [Kiritimatiellota bacterium]